MRNEDLIDGLATLARPKTGLEQIPTHLLWKELDYRVSVATSRIVQLEMDNTKLKKENELLTEMKDKLFSMLPKGV